MQVCSENANPNFTIFKLILGPIRKASCQSIIHLPISDISKHSPQNAYVTSCLRKEMHPSQIPVHSFIHSFIRMSHILFQTIFKLSKGSQRCVEEATRRDILLENLKEEQCVWKRRSLGRGIRVIQGSEEEPHYTGHQQCVRKQGFTLRQVESQWKGLTRRVHDLTHVFERSPPLLGIQVFFFSFFFIILGSTDNSQKENTFILKMFSCHIERLTCSLNKGLTDSNELSISIKEWTTVRKMSN